MKKPPKQKWDPQKYVENARFVADLGAPVVELLSPKAGEKILDLGCGDGALALNIVTQGSDLVAIDSSPEMVEAARALGLDQSIGSIDEPGHRCDRCGHVRSDHRSFRGGPSWRPRRTLRARHISDRLRNVDEYERQRGHRQQGDRDTRW